MHYISSNDSWYFQKHVSKCLSFTPKIIMELSLRFIFWFEWCSCSWHSYVTWCNFLRGFENLQGMLRSMFWKQSTELNNVVFKYYLLKQTQRMRLGFMFVTSIQPCLKLVNSERRNEVVLLDLSEFEILNTMSGFFFLFLSSFTTLDVIVAVLTWFLWAFISRISRWWDIIMSFMSQYWSARTLD